MLLFTETQTAVRNAALRSFDENESRLLQVNGGQLMAGNAAPIGLDAWRRIDQRGAMIQRDQLAVFSRLARGSQTPVDVADLVSYFGKVSDSGSAKMSMDGRVSGSADAATVTFSGTPVPMVHDDVEFGWRQWQVMTRGGGLQSADSFANAQRKVAEALEDMAINGASKINVAGATIYGLKTFPDRSSGTFGAFNLNGGTGANWLAAFQATLAALIADNSFGQATVFVNYSDWFYAGVTDYAANYTGTIAQRMLAIPGVREVIPCGRLAANDVIAVNNVDSGEWGTVLSAMPPVVRPQARHNPEDNYAFRALAMAAPQFRSDANSRSHVSAFTRT